MKKLSILLTFLLLTSVGASAQKRYSVYGVGFYNLENLFDTQHDKGKNDYEFLPEGGYRWNELKYSHKLRNMARVLAEMGTSYLPDVGCAIIGVSEVENARCLTDLCNQAPLKARNFKFCHIEGPDRRGVDCALLYNPAYFKVSNVKLVPYVYDLPKDKDRATRGFLVVSGTLAGEHIAVIVCHWPSRGVTSYYRESAGRQVKAVKDALLREEPNVKVIVMGDMNDDPTNKSMTKELSCKPEISQVGPGDMYNPWYNVLVKKGTGTLMYDGKWNLFDQIVMTPNLLHKQNADDYNTLKFRMNEVFRRDYLIQKEGRYKGSPKRTTAGGVWLDGFSDHLPVVIYLMKEQQTK